ncbi:rRNA adenine N-6-methyltransferase family protein [uncultured Desulfovibrio sp.]|uniref:class I SAM-dependent methyltransferase n=1 Tax=uncultured Desulfovibrio sp. TaxID=167968 RepID=UPI0025E0FE96|nr:rRNA adenine N-6-methyltransferase family protein [uncultured Desulfovibrio sp.]
MTRLAHLTQQRLSNTWRSLRADWSRYAGNGGVLGMAASFGAFWRQALRAPHGVGAVCPSSAVLAQTMADLLPPSALHGQDMVVELGPGTGVVTRALLKNGLPAQRLLLIERMPSFCRMLQDRFPHVPVVQGDAMRLGEYLPQGRRVAAIVSSLPLLSLPLECRTGIMAAMRQCLDADGRVIQFTYALWGRTPLSQAGFVPECTRRVLINLPPARVQRLRPSFPPPKA